jgi:type IV pilus assembly protein PilV
MKPNTEQGFSLIEVLVTLVLISIGMLGMVTLQTRTIQYTQDSAQRNTAIMLANDLVEMMRAMPAGLPETSGYYKRTGDQFPDMPNDCSPLPNNAADQLACWADKVQKALPVTPESAGGDSLLKTDFHVCRTNTANSCSNTGTTVEIQIAWRTRAGECMDPDDDADSTVCRYRLRTQI